jgi:hypothetical protein
MKASELRIGNYVLRTDGSLALIETGSDITSFWNPVVLTEEWLLKLGFKDDEPHSFINLDEHGVMSIQFDQYRKIISLFSAGAHYYLPEIKYVHQLQNLYYSLTGTELTIKE